jgi:choline dehydrogenase
MNVDRYDYIVVGGGSAGCIAAAELSADPSLTVLLLEAGDRAEAHPETLRADGYKSAFANDALIWERFSAPQSACGRQRLFMGSGTGLGGSGSVNGMVYIRGAREDYAEWPTGWHWDDVALDFDAIERVIRPRQRPPTEFTEACLAAAAEAGFAGTSNMNDGNLRRVLGYEFMNYENDDRRSSYVAFLREAVGRPISPSSPRRAAGRCSSTSRVWLVRWSSNMRAKFARPISIARSSCARAPSRRRSFSCFPA